MNKGKKYCCPELAETYIKDLLIMNEYAEFGTKIMFPYFEKEFLFPLKDGIYTIEWKIFNLLPPIYVGTVTAEGRMQKIRIIDKVLLDQLKKSPKIIKMVYYPNKKFEISQILCSKDMAACRRGGFEVEWT